MPKKYTYEFVYEIFKKENCSLLSTEYINSKTPLDHICSCGNPSTIRFADFLQGQRCNECRKRKIGDKKRLTYQYVKEYFDKHNCILLSTSYLGNKQKLLFTCECGNIDEVAFDVFQRGQRCKECGDKKLRENISISKKGKVNGALNPNWKGGISSEVHLIRTSIEYQQWRENILKRDNYTCQVCGNNKGHNLQAHHLWSFSHYKELRFDINNGITLCDNCHACNIKGSFHNIYGTINNTPDQFEEFKNNYYQSSSFEGDFLICSNTKGVILN